MLFIEILKLSMSTGDSGATRWANILLHPVYVLTKASQHQNT